MFAYQGFSYLFSQSKLDFYLSQPTTRNQRIRKNFANAIGTFTMMYVVVEVIALIIAACFGAVNGPVLFNVFVETIRTLITFVVVYSVTVLAMFLSGNMPTAILLTGFFAFIPAIISLELRELKDMFFATFIDRGDVKIFLSPFTDRVFSFMSGRDYMEGMNYNQSYNAVFEFLKKNWLYDLDTILVGIIAIVLIFVVSKARKVEHAGKSIIFRPFRWIVKITICVISGIVAIFLMNSIYFSKHNMRMYVLMCVIMVITAVIVGCVVEVLFDNNNIKSFNKGIAQTLMAVAVLLLIFVIHKGDLCGYDSYVPNTSSIESCAILDGNTLFNYYERSENVFSDYPEKNMYITDVDSFVEMAKLGMATMKKNKAELDESGFYLNSGWNRTILYRLKNGNKVYREIIIPFDIDPELMDRLVTTDEYKKGNYCCFGDEKLRELDQTENKRLVEYTNGLDSRSTTKLSYSELSDAFQKDVLEHYSFSLCKNELPIGQIMYTSTSRNYATAQFDVYADYENTLELLEKYDIRVSEKIDVSQIEKITITNNYPGIDIEGKTEQELRDLGIDLYEKDGVKVTYTDKKQIEQIVDSMFNFNFPGEWFNRENYLSPKYSIEINNGRTTYGGYGNGFYSFKPGEVPDFVIKDTDK